MLFLSLFARILMHRMRKKGVLLSRIESRKRRSVMRKNASTRRYGNKPPKNHMKILTNGKFFLMDGARLGFLFNNEEDKPLLKTGQLCVGVRKRLIKKLNGYLEN